MKKICKKLVIYVFLLCFLITNTGQVYAGANMHSNSVKEQKGPYYGKTIETGKKVTTVNMDEKKTDVSLRTPKVNGNNKTNGVKYKKEQEHKEKRTPNSKTYEVSKGNYETVVYLDKIHYEDSKGNLQDVDNTLVKSSKESKVYHNKSNDFKASLPSTISKEEPITVEQDKVSLEMIPVDGDFSRSLVKENAILYNDVSEGIDYQYTVLNTGIKEDIILNHYVNQNTFQFKVNAKGVSLKEENGVILGYEKGKKEPSLIINAPYMIDAGGAVSEGVEIDLKKKIGNDIITITADREWLASNNRAYPVQIDPTVTVGKSLIADNCVEEGSPDTNTNNAYSYIGYDDGIKTGNLEEYGSKHLKTRTFVRFNIPNIGEDQVIESAKLAMYKYTNYSDTKRTIELHRVNNKLSNSGVNQLTWDKQPKDTSFETSTDITDNVGYIYWDIKDLANSWYSGSPNNGVVLKYEDEKKQCEIFASREDTKHPQPKVIIEHKDKGAIDPGKPLDAPTIILRPLVKSLNNGLLQFYALSADGMSKPDSEVEYDTVPTNTEEFNGKVDAASDYIYPDIKSIPGVPDEYTTKESNWQTDQLFSPELNKVYKMSAFARFEEIDELGVVQAIETGKNYSDTFQIYQVTGYDLLTNVLNFYGIKDKAAFMKDNNMKDELLIEGNVIFLRNPKKNKGKPYTLDRKLTDKEKQRIDDLLMSRAKHCQFGFEPINLLNGNFYYTSEDILIPDYGSDFKISRTYNAKAAYRRSSFGYGWDFDYNKYIAYMEDGSKAFDRGDGSRIYFTKKEDGTYESPVGEYYTLEESAKEFKIEQKDESKYYFEKNGLLKAIEDKNGNKTVIGYDADYKLNSITTPSGKIFVIECDDEGRITSILLPNSETLAYGYDSNGNLVSFIDENGNETRYEYDEKGRMVSFYDGKDNKVITNTYDEQDRVIAQEDALGKVAHINYYNGYSETIDNNGNKTTYYYDENYRSTKVVYPDGNYEEFTYDEDNNLKTKRDVKSRITTYQYDNNGNVTEEKRWDGETQSYTYDESSNLKTAKDYNGNVTSMDYDDKGNILEVKRPDGSNNKYTYDGHGQVLTIKDPEGNITSNEYDGADITKVKDPNGNIYHYYYNPMGDIITVEDSLNKLSRLSYSPRGEQLSTLLPDSTLMEYIYDSNGNNTEMIDAKGNVVKFKYDPMDQLTEIKDVLGYTLKYHYDANGNKTEEIDEKGNITEYKYDELDRLIKTIDPLSGETSYEYDELGNILEVTDPKGNVTTYTYNYDIDNVESIKTAIGQTIQYDYDPQGNLSKTTWPDGNKISYLYDTLNRLTEMKDITGVVTNTQYDKNGRIRKIEDTLGRIYRYAYDGNGNILNTVDPLGYEVNYTYTANNMTESVTNQEGKITKYYYNDINKVESIKDPLGYERTFDYDENGNLKEVTDAKGNNTSYIYDPLDRLKAVKDSENNITGYSYDEVGNLVKQTDPLENETNYEYDGNQNLTKITDALGNAIHMKYDKNGNNTEVVDPYGDAYVFTYDAMNRMVSSADTLGVKKIISYDIMDHIIKEEDNAGNQMDYTYDAYGRLIEQKDTIGRISKYSYDLAGNMLTETAIDNNTTSYEYDKKGRVVSINDPEDFITSYQYNGLDKVLSVKEQSRREYKYEYNDSGYLTKEIDPLNHENIYKYDKNYNVTEVINAKGFIKKYEYDTLNRINGFIDERNNKTSYNYDPNGNLIMETDPIGNKTQYLYDSINQRATEIDALGFDSKYEYDKLGNLIKSTDAKSNITTYEYNKHKMLTKVVDALSGVYSYKYDLNDNLLEESDEIGAKTEYTYDLVHRLTSVIDPINYTMYYSYDDLGNIEKEYDTEGNINTFTYDIMHRQLSEKNTAGYLSTYDYNGYGNLQSMKQPNGNVTSYEYDILDRLIKTTDPEGKATIMDYDPLGNVEQLIHPGEQEYKYTFDEANNLKTVTNPLNETVTYEYNANNLQESVITPLGFKSSYGYNALNQLQVTTDPLGHNITNGYDPNGNLQTIIDANGNTTNNDYDSLNRLVKVTNPLGNLTNYSYDPVDNLTKVKDSNGNVTSYGYDLRHMLTSTNNPLGESESYAYNPVGTMVSDTKPDGTNIQYTYDILNQLSARTYGNATENQDTLSDTVKQENADSEDSVVEEEDTEDAYFDYNIMGSRTTMSGPEGDTEYNYDKMERLTSVNFPTAEEVKYEYDELGRKSKVIYPDGKYVKYSYDKLNRIIEAVDWEGQITSYKYDADGRRVETLLPNGSKVTYTYDEANRLLKLENIRTDGSKISSFEYSYDDAGNMIGETQNQNGSIYTRSYTYSDANQITNFTEASDDDQKNYTYTYDSVGNRLSEDITGDEDGKHIGYKYNEANELTTLYYDDEVHIKYEYDKNGNRIRKIFPGNQVEEYYYDSEDRLVQITEHQGKIQTFGYDSDGNRIYKTVGVYWEEPTIIEEPVMDEESPVEEVPSEELPSNDATPDNNNKNQKDSDLDHDNGKGNDFKVGEEKDNPKGESNNAGNNKVKGKTINVMSFPNIYIVGSTSSVTNWSILSSDKKDNNGNNGNGNSKNNGNGNSNSNSNSNSNGNNGNGNSNNNGNNGNGNSNNGNSNNGNNNSNGNKNNENGNDNSNTKEHDNGKDKVKDNDNGKHKGWNKDKLKEEKGNKGKHLGWYKNANNPKTPRDNPNLPGEIPPLLNKPDAYDIINYTNDVSVPYTQTLMTSDKEGVYRGVYTYGLERIAERDLVAVEGTPHDPLYYLYDGRGSVTQMMTSAEHPSDKYRFDPYGVPMPGGKQTPNTRLFNNPYGYNAEAYDIDSSLQYLRARYYDPEIGGFITRDSYLGEIMNPLSQNQYIYGLNNPLKYTDPSGNLAIMDTEGNVLYNHYTGNLIYTKGTEKDYTKKLEYIPDLEPSNPIRINYYKEQRKKKTLAKIDKYMKKFCDGASKIGNTDVTYKSGTVSNIINKVDAYAATSNRQLLYGDYTDDVTLLGTGMQMLSGATGLDFAADVRDLNYDFENWEWSLASSGDLVVDTAVLLPAVGTIKYADEAATLTKRAANNVGELVKDSKITEKISNAVEDFGESIGKKATKGASKADFYVKPNGDVIPSTGYRYMSETAPYLDELNKTKVISNNVNGTYFSFDKYNIASPGKLQVPHDASVKGSFDTLQIIDDIKIPNGNWGKASYLEPLTNDFPEFGPGGATQVITNGEIILEEITKLPK